MLFLTDLQFRIEMCVCACVYVCVRKREKEREIKRIHFKLLSQKEKINLLVC